MAGYFLREKTGQIATITFNRPEKRNPLNFDVMIELERHIAEIRDDNSARVLVLTATGNTFSAGADLSQYRTISDPAERQRSLTESAQRTSRVIGRVAGMLNSMEALTVSAVNGYAVGGGWSLALACDFFLAVEDAEFWFPEVDLGVPLGAAACGLVTAVVGPFRAREIIISCRHYKARDLYEMGMVNRVLPGEEFSAQVWRFAKELAAKSPRAAAFSKATINAAASRIIRTDLLLPAV